MSRRMTIGLIGGLLMAGHAALVAWIGYHDSPVIDEAAHVAAGVYIWDLQRFDVYRVNPPLVRTLAALPVVLAGARSDWSEYRSGLVARPEWAVGRKFVEANPSRWRWYFTLARWACLSLSLVGAYVCWRWARDLYGRAAGLLSLTLWCICPNVLAFAAHVTPDLGATALGVAAGYALWRWLHVPSGSWALLAGLCLGLAELTKATWIVLFGLWPALWLFWCWSAPQRMTRSEWGSQASQMAAILLVGLYILNLGYLFEGSFRPLGEYRFASRMLAGDDAVEEGGVGGNCFAEGWLSAMPVPLPEAYLTGIDLQKRDFERGGWSYLRGEWKEGGWWYFYLYALAVKVPLGTWLLVVLALTVPWLTRGESGAKGQESEVRDQRSEVNGAGGDEAVASLDAAPPGVGRSRDWRDEVVLLAPAGVVLILVSSEMGFNHHPRYVLPVLPFVFVAIGRVGAYLSLRGRPLFTILALVAVLWSVASSLRVYPHSLSYFNELAGGPKRGHEHLVSSAIDWGQDLFYLERWLDEHPEARPIRTDVYAPIGTNHPGIKWGVLSAGPGTEGAPREGDPRRLGPQPGWFAISVHRLHDRSGRYDYLRQHFEPTAMAGYSIYIYHITLEEANRARRTLGLPELGRQPADSHQVGEAP